MTATHTQDIDATVAQVNALARRRGRRRADRRRQHEGRRGAGRNPPADDGQSRRSILQENYRLAELVAPHVDKVRYNPGHLYHHERDKPWQEKVRYLADVAGRQRLRDARRRELRQRRSGQAGEVRPEPTRSRRCSTARWEHCRLLDDARLHALLRLAQGLRPARR